MMKRSLHICYEYVVAKMIGFLELPSGRMGNVLLQYVFLRQLADRLGIDYFHMKLPYAQYFENFSRRNISWKLLFTRKWQVDLKYIEDMGVDDFIKEAEDRSRDGYTIILKPPVLGHLFEFKEENPAKFLKIRAQYQCYVENPEKKVLAGLHFRGTDFKEWNDLAVLPTEYYLNAINYILKTVDGDAGRVRWLMFTDDNCFSTYCDTLKFLQDKGFDFVAGDAGNHAMEDFCRLSQCDYIVSSPSTFAIMAAIMGKENKKIIHNRKWVTSCSQKGEAFWKDIEGNKVPWYQVIGLI